MLTLDNKKLVFSFPEVHPDAICEIDFRRTLRLPDDNKVYPLPPGLGKFPLVHTEDYLHSTPQAWQKYGGVMMPMYQSEAMWICFNSPKTYPFAIKIAAGKINAVTGKQWDNSLKRDPQDYLAIPEQPWIDGFHTSDNMVRQFIAMPLGQGFSAEEQITGKAEFGGIQIIVYPMKARNFERFIEEESLAKIHALEAIRLKNMYEKAPEVISNSYIAQGGAFPNMGLAPGGRITQKIFKDPHNLTDYDTTVSSRCFVQLVNSEQWQDITNSEPPTVPFTAQDYEDAGLPWFDYYSESKTLKAGNILSSLKGTASKWLDKNEKELDNNQSISTKKVIKIKENQVNDGDW